jgi:hypothetical protein
VEDLGFPFCLDGHAVDEKEFIDAMYDRFGYTAAQSNAFMDFLRLSNLCSRTVQEFEDLHADIFEKELGELDEALDDLENLLQPDFPTAPVNVSTAITIGDNVKYTVNLDIEDFSKAVEGLVKFVQALIARGDLL